MKIIAGNQTYRQKYIHPNVLNMSLTAQQGQGHSSVDIGEFKFCIQHVLNRIMASKIPNFCDKMPLKPRKYVSTFGGAYCLLFQENLRKVI